MFKKKKIYDVCYFLFKIIKAWLGLSVKKRDPVHKERMKLHTNKMRRRLGSLEMAVRVSCYVVVRVWD